MADDEVVLATGVYSPPSQVVINKTINVHGEVGQPRPRVVRDSRGVFSVSGGGTLGGVQAEAPGAVITNSSTVEGVIALASAGSTKSAAVVIGNGGVLRDSIVRTESPEGRAVMGSLGVVHLVNVTAIATDPGSSGLYGDSTVGGICVPESQIELHATNVIAPPGTSGTPC